MPHQIGEATETSVIFTSAVERAMAQTENIQRVARTSGAMRARAKRGLHSCNCPHGYRAVRDTITGRITGGEIVSGEIEAVQLATDLFLNGYSYTKIVQALNASPWRPRRAKQWSWSVVRGMMNNDFYADIIVYGRKSDEPVYSLPSEARFPILWDDDTYRAILQERAHRKGKLGGSNPKSPLSGAVICGGCGWAMTIRTYRTGTRVFHCGKHKWAYVTGETCHTNTIREPVLIAAVEAALRALSEPGALDYALSQGGSADRATLELEKTQLECQAATIERKQIDLARKAIDGIVSNNAARIVTQELERELMHARERLQSIAKRLATMPTTDERRARLAHIIGSTDWLLSEPVDTVRAKLRRAGIWIVVAEHEIKQVYVGQMEGAIQFRGEL